MIEDALLSIDINESLRRSLAPFKVHPRALLGPGDCIPGPAIVDEGTWTTVIRSDKLDE